MIVKNVVMQFLQCSICLETVELRRTFLADPERVLLKMEELTEDHADCAKLAHDPRRAAIARGYKVRMREEMQQQARRKRRQP